MIATDSLPKYDVLSPTFLDDPHPTFRRMRVEDPVWWHPWLNVYCLTRYDDVQRLGRDPRFTAERAEYFGQGAPAAVRAPLEYYNRFIAHWMLLADPPRHTRLRSLIAHAFTPQAVERLRPRVQAIADELIDGFKASGRADIVRDIAYPLPTAVIAAMLGIRREDTPILKGWTDDLMTLLQAPLPTVEIVEIGHRGVVGLEGFFREVVAERRRHPGDDILSTLVLAEEQGNMLSEAELVSTCAMLLVAGHETTTNLISNSVLELLRAPEQLARLRADPGLIVGAVEELLRFNGAAFQLTRRAREPLELAGTPIAAGQYVLGFLHAANRDPDHFPDPEQLNLTRAGNRHLGLGVGIHHCIGAQLARIEAQVTLNTLLARLPDLALVEGGREWIPSILIRGLRSLPVTFTAGA